MGHNDNSSMMLDGRRIMFTDELAIPTSGKSKIQLSFWVYVENMGTKDQFRIQSRFTRNGRYAQSKIYRTFRSDKQNSWQKTTVTIPIPSNNEGFIQLRVRSVGRPSTSAFEVFIDDFTIEAI